MILQIIFFVLLGLGLVFAAIRLAVGPTAFDRVISLDMINIIITGLLAVIAALKGDAMYLDIALVFAVLAFLETIVFARFMEGKK
ncbi:MAG TPA: monovalent cation/H+ antiporter complex subunit F [Clostridia bacterium]|nr:monovalent cation/H+ antiporter complex subunit F [Clostridia bacterium]HPQ46218.1 monovalent cation/H+ antiporter complex subunit F [Clostridia bacterium]HRX42336.1 monovalent cation/H+ antiporter complex subunit F [Clostridia bacterium]